MVSYDMVVVGAGPAGLALASELAQRGARVVVVDPAPKTRWPATYCLWQSELRPGDRECVATTWSSISVTALTRRVFDRSYVCFDNDKLQDKLHHARVEFRSDKVARADTHEVRLASGQRIATPVVVDARGRPPGPTAQTAYGQLLAGRHGLVQDEAIWMDFSPLSATEPLTFAYVLPHGPDRVFVEETSLAGRPPPPFSLLARRLDERKARLGLEGEVQSVERCHIPLGGPLPSPLGNRLPFGAAAGFTHPATGFQIARTLQASGSVACALTGFGTAEERVARAWLEAWPADERRSYALLELGLQTLLGMNAQQGRRFFEQLFALPPVDWQAYLNPHTSPGQLMKVMLAVFGRVDWGLRRELASRALSDGGRERLRQLFFP